MAERKGRGPHAARARARRRTTSRARTTKRHRWAEELRVGALLPQTSAPTTPARPAGQIQEGHKSGVNGKLGDAPQRETVGDDFQPAVVEAIDGQVEVSQAGVGSHPRPSFTADPSSGCTQQPRTLNHDSRQEGPNGDGIGRDKKAVTLVRKSGGLGTLKELRPGRRAPVWADTVSAAAVADRKHGTKAAKKPKPNNTCCNRGLPWGHRQAVSPKAQAKGRGRGLIEGDRGPAWRSADKQSPMATSWARAKSTVESRGNRRSTWLDRGKQQKTTTKATKPEHLPSPDCPPRRGAAPQRKGPTQQPRRAQEGLVGKRPRTANQQKRDQNRRPMPSCFFPNS